MFESELRNLAGAVERVKFNLVLTAKLPDYPAMRFRIFCTRMLDTEMKLRVKLKEITLACSTRARKTLISVLCY